MLLIEKPMRKISILKQMISVMIMTVAIGGCVSNSHVGSGSNAHQSWFEDQSSEYYGQGWQVPELLGNTYIDTTGKFTVSFSVDGELSINEENYGYWWTAVGDYEKGVYASRGNLKFEKIFEDIWMDNINNWWVWRTVDSEIRFPFPAE